MILVSRALEGMSSAMIDATTGSICATFYPKHIKQMIGYKESALGIDAVAPVMGSLLFKLSKRFGFTDAQAVGTIFNAYAVLFFISAILVTSLLPPHFDNNSQAAPPELSLDDEAE